MTVTGIEIWTVYESPADYPGKWVARLVVDGSVTGRVFVADSHMGLIVQMAPAGLVRLVHDASDAPDVVETWV